MKKLVTCAVLVGSSIVGSGIVSAADCPPGWTVVFGSPQNVDKNGDNVYCYKQHNGKGNIEKKLNSGQPGARFNLKDNKRRK